MSKILVPIRYSAWLSGELGKQIQETLERGLIDLDVKVTKLPRALLIETEDCDGVAIEKVRDAARDLEGAIAEKYPVFHHEMGPVWTGTLQAIFAEG